MILARTDYCKVWNLIFSNTNKVLLFQVTNVVKKLFLGSHFTFQITFVLISRTMQNNRQREGRVFVSPLLYPSRLVHARL